MKYEKEIYLEAFDSWLKANIPKGKYSKAGEKIFGDDLKDPRKAFRRRRNEKTGWKMTELCKLAQYLNIDIPSMFNQVEGIYKVLKAGKKK